MKEDTPPQIILDSYRIIYDLNGIPQPPLNFRANVPVNSSKKEVALYYIEDNILKNIEGKTPNVYIHEVEKLD